jgi:hypothetical protein
MVTSTCTRTWDSSIRVQAYALRSFADFAERRSEEFVRADSVLEWAASAPSVRQRHHRLNIVHRLACALHAEDRRHEVPPTGAFGATPRRPRSCHIFTQDEIDRLLRAASELAPQGSIRPDYLHDSAVADRLRRPPDFRSLEAGVV